MECQTLVCDDEGSDTVNTENAVLKGPQTAHTTKFSFSDIAKPIFFMKKYRFCYIYSFLFFSNKKKMYCATASNLRCLTHS